MRVQMTFVGVIFTLSSAWAAPEDPAQLLFQEFAAKCSSQGSFTQRALSESRSLQKILERIQNDEECKDMVPVITALDPLLNAVPTLEIGLGGDQEEKDILEYIDRLIFEMSITTDPELQEMLASEIASKKFRLIQRRQELDELHRQSRVKATQAVLDYMTQLSKVSNSRLCFERHKTLPFQMAGQIASLAGLFMGPFFNQAIVIGGALIKSFFELISESSLTNKIKKYRDSQMWLGLTCAMEGLEDTVCDIFDQRDLIAVRRSMNHEGETRREWEGYELLTREYPILQDFFQLIKTGVGASSTGQGYTIQHIKLREAEYHTVQFVYEGMLRDARKELAAATDIPSKQTVLRRTSTEIAQTAHRTYDGDVADGEYERVLLWLRIGTAYPDLQPEQSLDDLINIINSENSPYPDDPVRLLDLGLLENRLAEIRNQAQQQLEIAKKLALNLDSERTMVAFSRTQGHRRSPENILTRSIQYLERLQIEWTENPMIFQSPSAQAAQLRMLASTKEILMNAMHALTDPTKTDAEKLNASFDILSLQDDEFRVANRMADIVELDVDVQIRLGALQSHEGLQTVLQIASARLVNLLTPTGGITDLEDDLENAEPMANQNLKNFQMTFKDSILAALDLLYQDWVADGSVPSSVYSRNFAKVCALVLNFPQIDKELQSRCKDMVYGLNETGPIEYNWDLTPLTVKFNDEVSKPWRKRACAYRHYRDKKKLIELYKSRPSAYLKEYRLRRSDGSVTVHKGYKDLINK